VDYDGFRVVFTKYVDSPFKPDYDVVQNNQGLLIVVDLPGVLEGDLHPPVINREKSMILLQVAGTRVLKYNSFVLSGKGGYEMEEPVLKSKFSELGWTVKELNRTELNRYRKQGDFELSVPIPLQIDDDEDKMQVQISDGVLRIFLPAKPIKPVKFGKATTTATTEQKDAVLQLDGSHS